MFFPLLIWNDAVKHRLRFRYFPMWVDRSWFCMSKETNLRSCKWPYHVTELTDFPWKQRNNIISKEVWSGNYLIWIVLLLLMIASKAACDLIKLLFWQVSESKLKEWFADPPVKHHVPAGFSSNSNTLGPANQGPWVCLKTTGQYVGAEFEVSTSGTEQRCPILFLEVHCPLKFSSNWSNSFKPANQGLLVYLKSTGQCVGAELLSSMIGTEYSCHRTGVSSHSPGGPLSCKV